MNHPCFCDYNTCNAISASCVDVYCNSDQFEETILKNLFVFFNSSVFWLLREISGRKNLGGGLLKSEAADLKDFPVFFNMNVPGDVLINLPENICPTMKELDTDYHRKIDDIVFSSLELSDTDRKKCVNALREIIQKREQKSKT